MKDRDSKNERIDHWRRESRQVLEEIRRRLQMEGLSQRAIEQRVGFSGGYLSQVLAEKVDLKVWHVLAILDAIGCRPGDFFGSVYPGRRKFTALRRFQETSQPLSPEAGEILDQLYDGGVESLRDLRRRLSRIEDAVDHLESLGLLEDLIEKGHRGEES